MPKFNRLSGKIKAAGMTQRDLADLMKIAEHTLSRKMKGHVDFTLSEVDLIVDFLDLSGPEVLEIFFSKKFV